MVASQKKIIEEPIRPYLPEPPSQVWEYLILQVVPLLKISKTTLDVLNVFETSDNAEELGKALKGNAYYANVLIKAVQARENTEKEARDEANAAVMLGMLNARNTICATQLWKNIHGEDLDPTEVENVVPFAIRAGSYGQIMKQSPPTWAYASGLVFDYIREIILMDDRFDKSAVDWLTVLFEKGFQTGRMAHSIGSQSKGLDFTYQRHAFFVSMINMAGHALISCLDPENYLTFYDNTVKEQCPTLAVQLMEEAWLGVNHTQMAALLTQQFPIFRELIPSVICLENPQVLKDLPKAENHFKLALLVNICVSSLSFKNPAMVNIANLPIPWDQPTIQRAKQQALASI